MAKFKHILKLRNYEHHEIRYCHPITWKFFFLLLHIFCYRKLNSLSWSLWDFFVGWRIYSKKNVFSFNARHSLVSCGLRMLWMPLNVFNKNLRNNQFPEVWLSCGERDAGFVSWAENFKPLNWRRKKKTFELRVNKVNWQKSFRLSWVLMETPSWERCFW